LFGLSLFIKSSRTQPSADFAASQLQAIHDAGAIAELNILRTVGEPLLAAVAHGLELKDGHQRVLVYDLGGSTFDVTLLSIEDGVFDILATRSDIHLGGHDFDQRVVDFFAGLYTTKTGTHVTSNPRAMVKLRRAVEQAKHALSSQHMAHIVIESFESGNDWAETLTRAMFEELNMDLFRETLRMVDQVLEDGGVAKEEVDQVGPIFFEMTPF
jgi:heat shock protein 5